MDHQRIADDLLWPIWRGIDPSYKSKYARSIWQQFEDNIRSAAYTSKLTAFLDSIGRKLSVNIRADDAEQVAAVIASGEDRAALKALREETLYLCLLVRVKNEDRKAEYEERRDKQEELF